MHGNDENMAIISVFLKKSKQSTFSTYPHFLQSSGTVGERESKCKITHEYRLILCSYWDFSTQLVLQLKLALWGHLSLSLNCVSLDQCYLSATELSSNRQSKQDSVCSSEFSLWQTGVLLCSMKPCLIFFENTLKKCFKTRQIWTDFVLTCNLWLY